MKIHIFGSLSGTEPMENRHHSAWALEMDNGDLYWFDAGENCSRAAWLMGLDLFHVRDIFISHSHIDHTGGLLNLFGVMRKMHDISGDRNERKLSLHLPEAELWELFEPLMRKLDAYPPHTAIDGSVLIPGTVLETPEISVEARGNLHMTPDERNRYRSFSFRILAGKKKIVFSGDVKDADELGNWLDDCDLLLMETGHHSAPELCRRWKKKQCAIGKIIFIHHGREILNHPAETFSAAREAWGENLYFASDRQSFEL